MRKSRFTPQYAEFLSLLREIRGRKGILQADLADSLGIPQQYISRFETGETRMDVVQLWEYCRALGISFPSLCRRLDGAFNQGDHARPSRGNRSSPPV